VLRREGGFSAFEVIGGAFVISIFFSSFYFVTTWMMAVKQQRARERNPHVWEQQQVIKEVKPGEEFGSFIITFGL